MHPASQILMMGTEMIPETSVTFNQLTRLITREDYINLAVVESDQILHSSDSAEKNGSTMRQYSSYF
jgi:hypothetical protein